MTSAAHLSRQSSSNRNMAVEQSNVECSEKERRAASVFVYNSRCRDFDAEETITCVGRQNYPVSAGKRNHKSRAR